MNFKVITEIEHMLLVPDVYIGNCDKIKSKEFYYNKNKNEINQNVIEHCESIEYIFKSIFSTALKNS